VADNLTPEQRSRCMRNVKGADTSLEVVVRSELHRRGLRFRKNVKGLPGRPDVVFARQKVAIFIDGDFWHGWRFPSWKESVSQIWQTKIEQTRRRDRRNFRRLRTMGWTVLRIWGHEVKADLPTCIYRIEELVRPI
jgi:DNA mismatch endonuclease (patch repair protein)